MLTVQPIISIITVVYNGEAYLEGTILSVLGQTYPHIEYIIVDGGSKDKTLNIVEKYRPKIQQFISEPDKGLYDAMNKGLRLATGDFVWFMNAGDRLISDKIVAQMVDKWRPETDVLYGEVMLVNDAREHVGTRSTLTTQKLPKSLIWKDLRRGMVVCHQAFLPRRAIAPMYALDNLSADIEWVILCLKKAKKTIHTELVLAEYLMGGVSKKQHQRGLKDRYKILKKHFGWLPNLFNHGLILVRGAFHSLTRIGKQKY